MIRTEGPCFEQMNKRHYNVKDIFLVNLLQTQGGETVHVLYCNFYDVFNFQVSIMVCAININHSRNHF